MAIATPRHFRSRASRDTVSFYLFISPWLLGFVALTVVPLALGLGASLTNYDGFNLDNLRFVRLANYARAFDDPDVWHALLRTFIFSLMNVPAGIGLALLLAIMLNGSIPGRGVFRTIFYLPHVIPIVAVIWIWRIFLDQNYGLLNGLLSLVWPDTAIRWTVDYPTPVLTALTVWMGVGGGMVIFLAGLQGIPNELKEAAKMDGATSLQVYRSVVIPLLTPVIFFQVILMLIGSLQTLVPAMLLSGDQLSTLPARDNYLFLVHAYQQVFAQQRYGYGLALIWMFLVVIVVLTYAVFRSARYWVYYEVDQQGGKA